MDALDVVTLEQAKLFTKTDFADDDALLTSLIYSAVALVEQKTQYRLYQRTETEHSDGTYDVQLFQTPLNAVTVTNIDNIPQPQFQIKIDPVRTIVVFRLVGQLFGWNRGYGWGGDGLDTGGVFTGGIAPSLPLYNINIDCGYTDVSLIPVPLIQAVKQIISYTYENRDMTMLDLPSNITMQLTPFIRMPLF